jgi:hypothetical protein
MAWHRKRWADLTLRAAGVLLLCLAALIAHRLFGAGPHPEVLLDYPLAALGFVSVSTGSALLWLGCHLFDQIELSARRTIYRDARRDRKVG